MHVPDAIESPDVPEEAQEFARAVSRAVNGELSFGDPTDIRGGKKNGEKDNMRMHFVLLEVTTRDAAHVCTHNLKASIAGAGTTKPNVIWWRVGAKSAAGSIPVEMDYQAGDAITENAITLRARAGAAIPNPTTILLIFQAVSPW
jgi:hypothetical protein